MNRIEQLEERRKVLIEKIAEYESLMKMPGYERYQALIKDQIRIRSRKITGNLATSFDELIAFGAEAAELQGLKLAAIIAEVELEEMREVLKEHNEELEILKQEVE